jgi:hypothetical protein
MERWSYRQDELPFAACGPEVATEVLEQIEGKLSRLRHTMLEAIMVFLRLLLDLT